MRLIPSAPRRSRARIASRWAVAATAARSSASIAPRSGVWRRGTTRAWPRVAGLMSMNATVRSSSATIVPGNSPATILQKMQSGSRSAMAAKPISGGAARLSAHVASEAPGMGRPGKFLPRAAHRKVKSRPMARSSLEAFSALWRAYGEGRLGDSLHLVDPECELSLLDGVGPVRGHDGVRDCLAAAQREWKTLRIIYDDLFEDHPGCVVGSGRLAASRTDGARVDRPLAFVAEFRAARLVRARVFAARADAVGAARALRLIERMA